MRVRAKSRLWGQREEFHEFGQMNCRDEYCKLLRFFSSLRGNRLMLSYLSKWCNFLSCVPGPFIKPAIFCLDFLFFLVLKGQKVSSQWDATFECS